MFILPLFTILFSRMWRLWRSKKLSQINSLRSLLRHLDSHDHRDEAQSILHPVVAFDDEVYAGDDDDGIGGLVKEDSDSKLGLRETAKLSFQFCLLWVN